MVHVMHYYGIQNVPAFEELASKHRRNNVDKPVVLKFLIDTPAGGMRGFNMLMPARSSEVQRVEEQDVVMGETVVEEEKRDEMEVGRVKPRYCSRRCIDGWWREESRQGSTAWSSSSSHHWNSWPRRRCNNEHGWAVGGHGRENWGSTRDWGFSRRLVRRSTKQARDIETTATNTSSDHEGSRKTETEGGSGAQGLHARQPTGDA